jgi:hypothetical protein
MRQGTQKEFWWENYILKIVGGWIWLGIVAYDSGVAHTLYICS